MGYNRRGGKADSSPGCAPVQDLDTLTRRVINHLIASPFHPTITTEAQAQGLLNRLREDKTDRPMLRVEDRTCPTCQGVFSIQRYVVRTFCSFRCWVQVYGQQARSSPSPSV